MPIKAPLLLHRSVETGHSLIVIIPSVLLLGGGLHALRQHAPQTTFVGISVTMLCIGLSLRLSATKALTLRAPVMYLLYVILIYFGYHLLLQDYLWQPIALSLAAATLPFGTWLGDVLLSDIEQSKTPNIVATRFYALSLAILPATLLCYALIGLLPRSFFLAIIPLLLASYLISQATKSTNFRGSFAFLTRTYPYLVIGVLILANII